MMQPAIPPSLDGDENTQQATQSTQSYSQQPNGQANSHLWGFLLPCSPLLRQIDFWKIKPSVTLGRAVDNTIVLPVVVQDTSTNGTFINGVKIGKGRSMLLHNGNDIAFGSPHPQPQGAGIEDYRFVFRFTALGPPKDGIWAKYDVGHELGTGSYATVRKAICRKTGAWVAIKMIRSNKLAALQIDSVATSASGRAAGFAREIQILKDLRHRNICQLRESFWTESELSLVLELVEGGDLLDYITTRDGLDEKTSKYLTYQICDALAYIHEQGVAHRDLKPENVLLTKDSPPLVKIADFGLAKYLDNMSMLKTMCGTPAYLAPEVIKGNPEGYDYLVDSWSVGVIVFAMLAVCLPFVDDADEIDLIARVQSRVSDWKPLEGKYLPQAEEFIRRMLDENPATRMSAKQALSHPWLSGIGQELEEIRLHQQLGAGAVIAPQQPLYYQQSIVEEPIFSQNAGDFDMAGIDDDGEALQEMRVDEQGPSSLPMAISSSQNPANRIPGAFPQTGNNQNGRFGLQRRSQVIADAAADGRLLPQPSVEMLARVALHTPAADVGLYGDSDSSLSPLPEDMEDDEQEEVMDAEEAASQRPVRKSRRPSAPKRKRVRGGRTEQEDGVMQKYPSVESPIPTLRRSARNTPGRR